VDVITLYRSDPPTGRCPGLTSSGRSSGFTQWLREDSVNQVSAATSMLGKHINHCEDSLTAAVFSHLLHLPAELFWQILRNACGRKLPGSAGEPKCEFWPKWEAAGTTNSSYIEPDVFIRFPDFDLIVEAKRWDGNMHDIAQWKRELSGYANEYGHERHAVRMIALGNDNRLEDVQLSHKWVQEAEPGKKAEIFKIDCPVYMCRWGGVLAECRRTLRSL
jgi:hypothetical protein